MFSVYLLMFSLPSPLCLLSVWHTLHPKKAEKPMMRHLSTKKHQNPLDGPLTLPLFLEVTFMSANIPIVPCILLSWGLLPSPGAISYGPWMNNPGVLVNDFHLALAPLHKQQGNKSSESSIVPAQQHSQPCRLLSLYLPGLGALGSYM